MTLPCARKKRTTKYSFAVYQKKHTAKHIFTVCHIFAVCAHSKEVLCRVPGRKHTAKSQILVVDSSSSATPR